MSAGRYNISAWLLSNYSVTVTVEASACTDIRKKVPRILKCAIRSGATRKKHNKNQMSDNDRKREMADVNTGAAGRPFTYYDLC